MRKTARTPDSVISTNEKPFQASRSTDQKRDLGVLASSEIKSPAVQVQIEGSMALRA